MKKNKPTRTSHAVGLAASEISKPQLMAASYKSADTKSRELGCWKPPLQSADKAMLGDKRITEGRAYDLVQNNGYASGAVNHQKDSIIGAAYRLQLQPAYKMLGLDSATAAAWASYVEAAFHAWADDPDCWIDAQRKRTFTQLLRESVATEMIQGEVFMSRQWRQSPIGYSTCFTTVAPERIATPDNLGGYGMQETILPNGNIIRAGVELDGYGAAVGYWVRDRHPNDIGYSIGNAFKFVPVRNEFGWRQMIHLFDSDRPDQTRGFSSMAATLQKLKMMDIQEDLELQATQLTTAFAMYLKSELGIARAKEIFSDPSENGMGRFLADHGVSQEAHYGDAGVSINGVKLPVLFPDDEIGVINGHQQPANHEQFKQGLMRQNARAWGMSYEAASGDFSQTSYSSARAAMQMAWQAVLAKRANVVNKLASHIFRLWFDEAVVRGTLKMPDGVNYWPSDKTADWQKFQWLTKCNWLGAGKIVIDEFKQAKANELIVSTGQGSLQDVLQEGGTDLETVMDAMVAERQALIDRELPLPNHLRQDGQLRATIAAFDPQAEALMGEKE